ncbi:sensor histidine kinase [Marinimicrobium locisalis]|uniref:sensor histidine kinase n=1 Tax=Marinimicrobium locisalis TaxID=546022 RepID=UPI00322211CC
MPLTNPVINRTSSYSNYDLLRVYTYYRTLLGSLLLLMFQGDVAPNILGNDHPDIFLYTSIVYTGLNIVTLGLLWRVKFLPSDRQSFVLLVIDMAAIALMMFASGGALSGLGYLLLVVVAAGGMLLPTQLAILLAALASITVIGESVARLWLLSIDNRTLFSAGTLGALLFITALTFQYLARKIRTSTQEALAQARQAEHLQRLAQLIVERMRTGIIVLNREQNVELLNHSASALLGIRSPEKRPLRLEDLPALKTQFERWRADARTSSVITMEDAANSEVKINFAALNPDDNTEETLVFVEDHRLITQQAQQLKLASLGRLTASIAHEVRNPLGAISHASQLLGESDQLLDGDRRLLQIIDSHSKRVNQIIENVLQLSRRRNAQPERLALEEWLPEFINEYRLTQSEPCELPLELSEPNIVTKFDKGQLQQVLTNLCDNGLRYSKAVTGQPKVKLEAGIDHRKEQPYIRVIDWGQGIAKEKQKHIFEPFFTTENTGSGLGLYICKELCEANQALIHYQRTDKGLSCFHIQLAHPERAL